MKVNAMRAGAKGLHKNLFIQGTYYKGALLVPFSTRMALRDHSKLENQGNQVTIVGIK